MQDGFGYPVLGQLRERAMGKVLRPTDGSKNGSPADLEAMRIIRQNLDLIRPRSGQGPTSDDRSSGTILVTSPGAGEGKSTVATGLAFAGASAGERTLLVEADTRQPSVGSRLGLESGRGLTDVLVGNVEAEQVIQTVPGAQEAISIDCIVSGSKVGDPGALLGSERFASFLSWANERYSLVIVDCSPLVPVADTLGVLPVADSVVLCARSGETTREMAGLAKDALNHRPDASPVGLVLTGLRRRDQREYGYA
jgi:non-specific protein-tyrosine kinase